MKKFVAFRTRVGQDLFGNRERCVNYTVEKLLMKQANEALLPIVTILDRIGNRLFGMSGCSNCLAGVKRSSGSNMAVRRAEGYCMDDAADQHKREHTRQRCACSS